MKTYILVILEDVEVKKVRGFSSRKKAIDEFRRLSREEGFDVWLPSEMKFEVGNCIAGSGDDTYAIQIFEVEVE